MFNTLCVPCLRKAHITAWHWSWPKLCVNNEKSMAMIFASLKVPYVVPLSHYTDMVELIVLDIKRGWTFTKLLMPLYQSGTNHAWADVNHCWTLSTIDEGVVTSALLMSTKLLLIHGAWNSTQLIVGMWRFKMVSSLDPLIIDTDMCLRLTHCEIWRAQTIAKTDQYIYQNTILQSDSQQWGKQWAFMPLVSAWLFSKILSGISVL